MMTTAETFSVGEADVMDLSTVDRYAVCERETRRVVVWRRTNGSAHHMTYRTRGNAVGGMLRAAGTLTETELMVVDREAE